MKTTYTLLAILFCTLRATCQSTKEESFTATIKEVIFALSNRDSVKLSKFENSSCRVFILYADDTAMIYRRINFIGYTDTTFPNKLYYDQVKYTAPQYATLPVYNCENFQWNKSGIFVDTNRVDHYLSQIITRWSEGQQVKMTKYFYDVENRSRRIVVSDNKFNSLIFYLSYIDDKWYLTIIDKYSMVCKG